MYKQRELKMTIGKTNTAEYWCVEDGEQILVTIDEDKVTFTIGEQVRTLERWRAEKLARFIDDNK